MTSSSPDEYQDPLPEDEYMEPGASSTQNGTSHDAGFTDHQEPEVHKGLSLVASTPGKNIVIFVIILFIMAVVVYTLFFSEETPTKEGANGSSSGQIQLPGPVAPDPETLTNVEEPPAPDLEIVQVTPDIVLPELPPLVPPQPPQPPQPAIQNIPGQPAPNETLSFIIGNEELQDSGVIGTPPPTPGAPPAEGGGQNFNSKAVNSLVIGGDGGGGTFGGGADGSGDNALPTLPGLPPTSNDTAILNTNKLGTTDAPTVVATRIRSMEMTIAQGKLMEAVLETAINTDLPGLVRALITRNVYAEQGGYILIPRGSRLIGNYESTIKRGQQRVFIIWNRVIRPDGVDVAIESPGTDRLGRAGVEGIVDNKYFEIFGNSILISTITTSAALIADQFSDTDGVSSTENTDGSSRTTGSVSDVAISEAVENLGTVGSNLAEQLLDSQPTVTVDQGTRINIFVNKDLVFPPEAATRYVD